MSKKTKIEKFPFLLGNGLEHLMRGSYENGDIKALLSFVPDMPCKVVLAVCEKRAHIEGDNLAGFSVVFDDDSEGGEDK